MKFLLQFVVIASLLFGQTLIDKKLTEDLRDISVAKYFLLKGYELALDNTDGNRLNETDSLRLMELEVNFATELFIDHPELKYLLEFENLHGIWVFLKADQMNELDQLNPNNFILIDDNGELRANK
ncbi:MAG: hypothetical protein HQ568_03015 [Calditrichaeota bacterium]|nr:hypothetical protein [Calditrichota bacterium]